MVLTMVSTCMYKSILGDTCARFVQTVWKLSDRGVDRGVKRGVDLYVEIDTWWPLWSFRLDGLRN